MGYPIWWNLAPRQINTFIELNELALDGKKVIPFATSGGSTITGSVQNLEDLYGYLNLTEGKLLNDISEAADWAKSAIE